VPDEQTSYRINDQPDQVRREQDRLRVLARVADARTRRALTDIGIAPGWRCCDVGSGAGTVVAWMAEQVGPTGRVLSLDVDTRFQPPSAGIVEVRDLDVTRDPIGENEFDVVHARGVLQHLVQREAVLDAMIAAAKPGGWVVVGDVDWIQYDAQIVPEPFATLSRTLRDLSVSQNGYDGTWGRRIVDAYTSRGLADVNGRGEVWTMRGGTDSAEWYVAALERALDVIPTEVFPAGFDPRAAIDQARPRVRNPLSNFGHRVGTQTRVVGRNSGAQRLFRGQQLGGIQAHSACFAANSWQEERCRLAG
jgi:ubiquinone/menaquinone biosynthesis C-methylase UbiE